MEKGETDKRNWRPGRNYSRDRPIKGRERGRGWGHLESKVSVGKLTTCPQCNSSRKGSGVLERKKRVKQDPRMAGTQKSRRLDPLEGR